MDATALAAQATRLRQQQDHAGLLHCLDRLEGKRDGDTLALWRADALVGLGRFDDALLAVAGVLRARPSLAAGWVLVGEAQLGLGLVAEADRAFAIALGRDAELRGAWLGRCRVAERRERWADVVSLAQQAVRRHPQAASLWAALSRGLAMLNRPMQAAQAADRAVALEPSVARRWWAARVLPIVPASAAEARRFRQRYGAGLAALARDPSWGAGAESAVWDARHLHDQHDDVRREQELLGRLMVRAVGGPGDALPRPHLGADERIRVGVVGSVLRRHTAGGLVGGWLDHLDPERFELFGVHLDGDTEGGEEVPARFARSYHHRGDVAGAVRTLQAEQAHVLLYPELGTDRRVMRIAARRLAPTQAMAWGHPVTSGLPTMDVFLSSEAMEPADGDAHYSETLVRLPGLGLCVEPPALQPQRRDRAHFNLPQQGPLLLVSQSLLKLRAEHDALIAEICARAPHAHLVLLASAEGQAADSALHAVIERLTYALAARNIRSSQCLHVIPGQSWADYIDLNRVCDILLDVPGWSGVRTTLEGLAAGLVPVTLQGPMMRQRHTAAILSELGMPELIAADHAAYVELVVSLTRSTGKRKRMRAALAERLPQLWRDLRPVRALADWLESCVDRV